MSRRKGGGGYARVCVNIDVAFWYTTILLYYYIFTKPYALWQAFAPAHRSSRVILKRLTERSHGALDDAKPLSSHLRRRRRHSHRSHRSLVASSWLLHHVCAKCTTTHTRPPALRENISRFMSGTAVDR